MYTCPCDQKFIRYITYSVRWPIRNNQLHDGGDAFWFPDETIIDTNISPELLHALIMSERMETG